MKMQLFLSLLICSLCVQAQSILPTYPLSISSTKTSNLLFPYPIRSVDRGSSHILAQKPKGAANLLQLKASRPHFAPTNVTVVTSDGRLYCFTVTYADSPLALSLSFQADTGETAAKVETADRLPDDDFLANQASLLRTRRVNHFHQVRNEQLTLAICHLAIDSLALWFDLSLYNRSHIPFQPAFVRFFVQDRHRPKRTAIQSIEQIPLQPPALSVVGFHERLNLAIPFLPFSIASTQQLVIQVGEQRGGRTLRLRLSPRQLLSATPLP